MTSFFCSWSGGKDSSLAFYRAKQIFGSPKFILTMFIENGLRSRMHGLSLQVIKAQAEVLGVKLVASATSWDDYRSKIIQKIKEIKAQGVMHGVFGDIDLESAKQWEEGICKEAGVKLHLPLWQNDRRDLLAEFLSAGFKASIVAVNNKFLGKEYLGRILDQNLIADFSKKGIDLCGENGEYHSVVFDGPIFQRPLNLQKGIKVFRDGYWFLDYELKN